MCAYKYLNKQKQTAAMEKIDDFFIPENSVDAISEDAYTQAAIVVNSLKAFARLTYQSVYVIDYFKQNFLYVSDNPLFLCGFKPKEVRQMGYSFYFNQIPRDEVNMLLEINRAGFRLFKETPIDERMKLYISYDFHIMDKGGYIILINHKLTPIFLADNGNIWLAACVVSLSSHKQAGNIEAHMDRGLNYWTYSMINHKWEKQNAAILKDREKEVLIYSDQGFTEELIAKNMYLEKETIKYHKQNLFSKLGVNSMSSAIAIAFHKKMI